MRATIVHESRGRMRLRLRQKTMSLRQADLMETWLKAQPWTKEAVVHERTGCVIVTYAGEREIRFPDRFAVPGQSFPLAHRMDLFGAGDRFEQV